jgi:hypothetical protein
VPHEEPRIVLRRRELNKDGKKDAGRIVVSREQVFDAIERPCTHGSGKDVDVLSVQVYQCHPATCANLLQDVCWLVARRIRLVTLRRAAGNP